jgi:hypothetical protein
MKLIFCDDDRSLFVPLTELAQSYNIELICRDNWTDAQKELEDNWNEVAGIILDFKGKRTSASRSHDKSHLTMAIGWLREQKSKRKYFPVYIYTGFAEEAIEIYPIDELIRGVYDKDRHNFRYVVQEIIKDIEITRIIKLEVKYPEPYQMVKEFFSEPNKEFFIKLFINDNFLSTTIEQRIENLINLRRLHEHLWDIICEHYLFKDLDDFIAEPGKRTKQIRELVNGDAKIIPSFIYSWSNNLYNLASSYGDHNPINDPKFDNLPSIFVIANLCYGLLEAMVWCNQLIYSK